MQTKFVPPAQREDDLSEWTDENEVAANLRDLPAAFGVREEDLGLEGGTAGLVRQFRTPDNRTLAEEAKAKLMKLQLIVLNLMLYSSGYRGEPVTQPVKEWDTAMLVGDDLQPSNFGNIHLQSRQSDDSRYTSPVSPGEGWWFRMVDYKENFLVVLKSLRYFMPTTPGAGKDAMEKESSKWALKMIRWFMKEPYIVQEPAKQSE